jgi:hypothetical protein
VGVFAGPEIVEDGLVLALDAGNLKSYDKYENLITYSEDFTQSIWDAPVTGRSRATRVTSTGIDDPSGGTTAATYKNGGTLADELIWRIAAGTANVPYTMSVWIRRRTGTGQIDFVVGDNIAVEVTSQVTTEWKRISVTATPTQTTVRAYILIKGINDEIDIWGYQLEQGESATDYYATTGTAKTRGSVVSSGVGTLTGTLTNGVGYNSGNGGSLVFDGTNDEVFVNNSLSINFSGTQQYTALVWAYPLLGGTTWHGLISKGNSQQYALTINSPNAYLHYETNQGGISALNSSASSVVANTWQFFGMRFDGTNKTIWKNANIIATQSATTLNSTSNTEQLRIGEGNNGEQFRGNIAIVQIYNRALTASEIQQNFNATRSRFGI